MLRIMLAAQPLQILHIILPMFYKIIWLLTVIKCGYGSCNINNTDKDSLCSIPLLYLQYLESVGVVS